MTRITKGCRWINKISFENRQNIKNLFKNGLSIFSLAKKFNVDRKTISYHVKELLPLSSLLLKKKEVININPVQDCPHNPFKPLPEKYFKPVKGKMYKDYLREEEIKTRKKNDCQHVFWIKKCYTCKKIIENEKNKIEIITKCKHISCFKKCSSCGKRF